MKLFKKLRDITAAAVTLKEDETGLFIPNRQVSWVVSFVLLFGFLTFMAGYFWGQRKAITRFINKVEEESFADRISYSLYTMNDRDVAEFENPDGEGTTTDIEKQQEEIAPQPLLAATEPIKKQITEELQRDDSAPVVQEVQKELDKIFVAPLAGFGTLHAASAFAGRVRKLEPGVKVKTRVSTTPKGKKIVWYQAVTGEFNDRSELERIIKQVKSIEHIKDIKIIEKRKVTV